MCSWIHVTRVRSELCLEYVEAAQSSFLTQDRQLSYAFKHHAIDESTPYGKTLTTASFCRLLVVDYLLSLANSETHRRVTKQPYYHSVVTITAFGFLNCISIPWTRYLTITCIYDIVIVQYCITHISLWICFLLLLSWLRRRTWFRGDGRWLWGSSTTMQQLVENTSDYIVRLLPGRKETLN